MSLAEADIDNFTVEQPGFCRWYEEISFFPIKAKTKQKLDILNMDKEN